MNKGFTGYLFAIGMITVLIVLGYILTQVIKRAEKPNNVKQAARPISCGNISVFFDRSCNTVIVPYRNNLYNIGKAVAEPLFLNYPYLEEELGEAVRKGMETCSEGKPLADDLFMKLLGYKSWKDFTKDRRSISINFIQKKGIVMYSTRRSPEGAYSFNGRELVLAASASDRDIGIALKTLLAKSS